MYDGVVKEVVIYINIYIFCGWVRNLLMFFNPY